MEFNEKSMTASRRSWSASRSAAISSASILASGGIVDEFFEGEVLSGTSSWVSGMVLIGDAAAVSKESISSMFCS